MLYHVDISCVAKMCSRENSFFHLLCKSRYWPGENEVYYMWLTACFSSSLCFHKPFPFSTFSLYLLCMSTTCPNRCIQLFWATILFHYIFTRVDMCVLVYLQLVRTRNMYSSMFQTLYFYRNIASTQTSCKMF